MNIKIAHFYPEFLNMYSDKGNIESLVKRCNWRGIETEISVINKEDEVDLSDVDILLIGGGADSDRKITSELFLKNKEKIKEYVENNKVLLALTTGFLVLGNYYYINDEKIEGTGIVDMYSTKGKKRVISDIVVETPFGKVAGFENHSDKIYIGKNEPFGNVLYGSGNNGEDSYEGVIYKNVIGTNMYGPLLPKNPEIADEIIKRALENKYKKDIELASLDDFVEMEAKNYIIDMYIK